MTVTSFVSCISLEKHIETIRQLKQLKIHTEPPGPFSPPPKKNPTNKQTKQNTSYNCKSLKIYSVGIFLHFMANHKMGFGRREIYKIITENCKENWT